MKKLNCDYILTDVNGLLLKKGHIKYSISHYIYALYQKNYNVSLSPKKFWNNFNHCLNKIGLVAYAFVNNAPEILNKASRIGIMQMLHSFGYFAFNDINGTYPTFVKYKNKTYLVDYNANQAMSFGFKIPNKRPKVKYSKLFMTSFNCSSTNSFINKNGTFTLKIVDPSYNNMTSRDELIKYSKYKKSILKQLEAPRIYDLYLSGTSIRIHISKSRIDHFKNNADYYSDGEIHIYVEELLKPSEYLHFIDDERLVLSLRTASLIELEEEKYSLFKSGEWSCFNYEEIKHLKEMGFLVPNINEFEDLQKKRKKEFNSSDKRDKFGFTILTTTACNARCSYCFEKGIKPVAMDSTAQKKIGDFICNCGTKRVHISWFGGEPLLNIGAIDYITDRMLKSGILFTESIVTNGYLVNKYIDSFDKWKVNNVQITLDGIYSKYDEAKNYVYGGKAFERVLSNIELLLNREISVSIRLNFCNHNYLDILECIDFIHEKFGNNKNLRVYAHHIFGESYHLDDGTNVYGLVLKKLIDCGYVKNMGELLLKSKMFFCFINNKKHLVIDPTGNLFLCEHITNDNKKKCIGHIDCGINNKKNYIYWSSLNYPYEKCDRCKYLFLCQGGCKNERNEYSDSCCLPHIDSIDELIKYYYNKKKEKIV